MSNLFERRLQPRLRRLRGGGGITLKGSGHRPIEERCKIIQAKAQPTLKPRATVPCPPSTRAAAARPQSCSRPPCPPWAPPQQPPATHSSGTYDDGGVTLPLRKGLALSGQWGASPFQHSTPYLQLHILLLPNRAVERDAQGQPRLLQAIAGAQPARVAHGGVNHVIISFVNNGCREDKQPHAPSGKSTSKCRPQQGPCLHPAAFSATCTHSFAAAPSHPARTT